MDTTEKILWGGAVGLGFYFLLLRGSEAAPILIPSQVRHNVMDHADWIWRAGVEHNVEPALIASVIHRESEGDPGAIGAAREVGLMQILPSTGEWMCGQTSGQLLDPIINTRCGAKYLRYLLDMFNGNIAASLCAYNAGPKNVWVDETRGGKIVAPASSKRYSQYVMERVPSYRELLIQRYPTYYRIQFRPDQWFLNFGMFD